MAFFRRETFVWNTTTSKGYNWLSISGAGKLKHDSQETFQKYVELYTELGSPDGDAIQKDVEFGRTDPDVFTWELAEILMSLEIPIE
jgi:hypothetical protein